MTHSILRLILSAILLLGVACTDRERTTGAGPLPVAATAYPSPESRDEPVAKDPPQDIQELQVSIVNGVFGADRYDAQARATRLVVTTRGGPYTLTIDNLLQPRQLTTGGTTELELTLPDPGEYTMRIDGQARDTAVLNVRPAGAR